MFDIGFAELLIIAIVGLIVIGPERLPEAVRTGSAWLNRFRRGFNDIKREVQQELHNDKVMRELRDSGEALRRETDSLRRDLRSPIDTITGEVKNLATGGDTAADGGETPTAKSPADTPATESPKAGD